MVMMRGCGFSIILCALLTSAPGAAQGDKKKDKEEEEKKDDRDWKDLSETQDSPDAIEEEEEETRDPTRGANPYRDTGEPEPVAEVKADDDDRGNEYSESVAWMVPWVPHSGISHASVEYEVWSTSDFAVHTWDVVVQLSFGDPDGYGAVHFDLPWDYVSALDVAAIANPVVGGQGGAKVHDQIALWGGLKIAIPTVTSNSDPERAAAVAAGTFVRAAVESHRFALFYVPLRFALGAEFQIHPLVYLRIEADPMVLIPTEGQDAEFVMDQINEIEALSPIGLGGGLRFQEAFVFTSSGDMAQLALEPYIAYEPPFEGPFSIPLRARVGLLFALDSPLGFGFDSDPLKVASVRTAVGGRF